MCMWHIKNNGDLLRYSHNTYQNTFWRMKQEGKLSREVQWVVKSRLQKGSMTFQDLHKPMPYCSNSSELGFYIGPICITAVFIADDTYIIPEDSLQGLIDIIG